jgi:hypothetical protein
MEEINAFTKFGVRIVCDNAVSEWIWTDAKAGFCSLRLADCKNDNTVDEIK